MEYLHRKTEDELVRRMKVNREQISDLKSSIKVKQDLIDKINAEVIKQEDEIKETEKEQAEIMHLIYNFRVQRLKENLQKQLSEFTNTLQITYGMDIKAKSHIITIDDLIPDLISTKYNPRNIIFYDGVKIFVKDSDAFKGDELVTMIDPQNEIENEKARL